MWIYYYCTHGPGHQGSDYDYECFDDSMSMNDIKEYLDEMMCQYDWPVLNFWKVKNPPIEHVSAEIRYAKERIASLQVYVNQLEKTEGFTPDENDGGDRILKKNLSGCIMADLLKRMHKAGLMYSADDVSNWEYDKKHPMGKHREKILAIMRRTKKYPSIASQLKGNK